MSDMTAPVCSTVKELKQLGPAPEGHTYVGSSLAYWQFHKESAFKCYDSCKWDGYDGEKQQVIVQIAPDVDSLRVYQGSGASWRVDEHGEGCAVCGVVFVRLKT